MKKLTWTWKKIVALILGFLGIGTLTSCYGVLPPLISKVITGTVMGDIDGDGIDEPVSGILYTFITGEYQRREGVIGNGLSGSYYSNGRFEIETSKADISFGITFTDFDGEENGFFKTKTITGKSPYDEEYLDLGEIHLEKADKED